MLPTTLRDGAYVPKRVKEEIDFDGPIERGAKKMRAQRVQEFLTLNGFAVSIDGDFGPATEKRVRDFQTARGLPATGVVDMKTHEELVAPIVKALNPIAAGGKSLSTLAAAYAKQHIKNHPREAGGDNRGPWVRSYLDWDGKDARWCAGFVCFALEQAAHTLGVQLPIDSSSSCDVLAMEAKTPGDWVHVGIVTAPAEESFDTAEGNTDCGGSSSGFEAAERARGYQSKDFIVW
jgi:hypothetical protein